MKNEILGVVVAGLGALLGPSGSPGAGLPGLPALDTLRAYLAIDTTNPPGNEAATARFLAGILAREGIEHQVLDLGGGRANVWARVRGTGARRPVVLLHHMDVVPADASHWTHPPFAGAVDGGYVYGRGALDIKTKGIIDLLTLVGLAREKVRLSRDVLFVAVADEEVASIGTRRMLAEGRALVGDAEYLFDEGGVILAGADGRSRRWLVAVAEKFPLWLRVTFTGKPGHGSEPHRDSSVARAVAAAGRLLAWEPELRVDESLLDFVETLFEGEDPRGLAGWAGSLRPSLASAVFLRAAAAAYPRVNAALRDTVALTQLAGSDKINSIPNEASLGLDCRLLPGTVPEDFLARLRAVIADDGARVTVVERPDVPGTSRSPADSELMLSLRRVARRLDPGVPVTPCLLTSSTDSMFWRAAGVHAYGFEPYRVTWDDWQRCHGNDERMAVANLEFGVEVLTAVLRDLGRPIGRQPRRAPGRPR